MYVNPVGLGCMGFSHASGDPLPEDVSVIGFMSDWVSDMATPRVTFVRHNPREYGKKAFKLLQNQIDGDYDVYHVLVNARLVVRDSTRKVP